MQRTIVVIPDPHANPKHNNLRALYAGRLIRAVKPDIVVNLGDHADMESLCSYDKGQKQFIGRRYADDIDSHNAFQEALFHDIKKSKKKKPYCVALIGNHDQRIHKAVQMQPELERTISIRDLNLHSYYDEVVPYVGSTPGSIEICGVNFAHFLVSGVFGKPISGEYPATALINKRHSSCVVGHSHLYDLACRPGSSSRKLYGFHAGCFIDYPSDWAGHASNYWWRGLHVLRNVEAGEFDLESVSMTRLFREFADYAK